MVLLALAPAGAHPGTVPAAAESDALVFSDLPAAGGQGRDLYRATAAGEGRRRITNTPDRSEDSPAYSPGGDRVAFAGVGPGPTGALESAVYVMPAAGGEALQITGGPQDLDPAWRPDGRGIAFTSRFATVSAIVLTLDDGLSQQPLAQLDSADHGLGEAAWSPDGARLALVVQSDAQGGELWSIAADGGDAQRLFRHPGWDDRSPAWAPDGRRIAFASGPFRPGATRHDIWLLDVDTGIAGTVVTDPSLDLGHPAWSPEGRRLAYDGRPSGGQTAQLFTVAGPGAKAKVVTSGSSPDWWPGAQASASPAATATPGATLTPGASPTASPGTGTAAPPGPSLPPPPPPAPPFPTPGPPEATSTGPAPAYPSPTPTLTAPPDSSPTAPGRAGTTLFLPALPGGDWPPAN